MLIKCETIISLFDKKHLLSLNNKVIQNMTVLILTIKKFGGLKYILYFINSFLEHSTIKKGIQYVCLFDNLVK